MACSTRTTSIIFVWVEKLPFSSFRSIFRCSLYWLSHYLKENARRMFKYSISDKERSGSSAVSWRKKNHKNYRGTVLRIWILFIISQLHKSFEDNKKALNAPYSLARWAAWPFSGIIVCTYIGVYNRLCGLRIRKKV